MSRGTQAHGHDPTTRRLRGSHPLRPGFPAASPDSRVSGRDTPCPTTPPRPKARRFGRGPPSLAATTGLSYLIPLPRGTEMFQFPRCPSLSLCIQPAMPVLAHQRVAPFGFGRLIARLQLPAHVSPLSASFLGTWPQGIPPIPFSAWHVALSRWLPIALHARPSARSFLPAISNV